MATTTTNLGLPRPVAADNVTLASQQALIDAIDANVTAMPTDGLSRQAIINGNFDVWQRGTSFVNPASGTYTADRWRVSQDAGGGTLPTLTHRQLGLSGGEVDESSRAYWIENNGAGSSLGATSIGLVEQYIENGTRALCGTGKKITVSFWAWSTIAGKRLGVYAAQTYGTGGSPSTGDILSGTNFTLSTVWTKYSYTFTTSALSGKTFGTNNDDTFNLSFMYAWGTSFLARVGAATAETFGSAGNTYIAQVQVSAGGVALPFQPRSFAEEAELCKRMAFVMGDSVNTQAPIGVGFAASTTIALVTVPLPVTMRIPPTLAVTATDWRVTDGATDVDVTSISVQANQNSKHTVTLRVTVASGLTQFRPYQLNADGTAGRKMIFDSEF